MIELGKSYKVTINSLDFKGEGVTKVSDVFCYVKHTLPGEEAIITITKIAKNHCIGKLDEIVKKSDKRSNQNSDLGALSMIHVDFNYQLEWQTNITKDSLEKGLGKKVIVDEILTDNNQFNYRNKVTYHALRNGQYLTFGLYNHDNDLIVVNDFVLASKITNQIITKINGAKLIFDSKITHLMIKNNEKNEYLVTLVGFNNTYKDIDKFIETLKTIVQVKGVTFNLRNRKEVILGNKTKVLYGEDNLKYRELYITEQSFMQVNFGVMEKTYEKIKKYINTDKIVDAYSGVGSIGFSILNTNMQLTMIESNQENVIIANKIKAELKTNNINIINKKTEDEIENVDCNLIIVDPPRTGLTNALIETIIKKQINRVIYLSCNLQTLIRDLRLFNDHYDVIKAYPIKMFPQTNSFETLVILDYQKGDRNV